MSAVARAGRETEQSGRVSVETTPVLVGYQGTDGAYSQIAAENYFAYVGSRLKTRGYTIKRSGEFDEHNPGVWGDSELIAVDPKTGELLGGHDTRKGFGKAAGY